MQMRVSDFGRRRREQAGLLAIDLGGFSFIALSTNV